MQIYYNNMKKIILKRIIKEELRKLKNRRRLNEWYWGTIARIIKDNLGPRPYSELTNLVNSVGADINKISEEEMDAIVDEYGNEQHHQWWYQEAKRWIKQQVANWEHKQSNKQPLSEVEKSPSGIKKAIECCLKLQKCCPISLSTVKGKNEKEIAKMLPKAKETPCTPCLNGIGCKETGCTPLGKKMQEAKGLRENYYPNPSFEKRMYKGVQKFGCNFLMNRGAIIANQLSSGGKGPKWMIMLRNKIAILRDVAVSSGCGSLPLNV
jgi:hypothetical protein